MESHQVQRQSAGRRYLPGLCCMNKIQSSILDRYPLVSNMPYYITYHSFAKLIYLNCYYSPIRLFFHHHRGSNPHHRPTYFSSRQTTYPSPPQSRQNAFTKTSRPRSSRYNGNPRHIAFHHHTQCPIRFRWRACEGGWPCNHYPPRYWISRSVFTGRSNVGCPREAHLPRHGAVYYRTEHVASHPCICVGDSLSQRQCDMRRGITREAGEGRLHQRHHFQPCLYGPE